MTSERELLRILEQAQELKEEQQEEFVVGWMAVQAAETMLTIAEGTDAEGFAEVFCDWTMEKRTGYYKYVGLDGEWKKGRNIEIIDVWRDPERKQIRVDGELTWEYFTISEDDLEALTEKENPMRIVLYGEPKVGKILLVNYAYGDYVVVDSVDDVDETVRYW